VDERLGFGLGLKDVAGRRLVQGKALKAGQLAVERVHPLALGPREQRRQRDQAGSSRLFRQGQAHGSHAEADLHNLAHAQRLRGEAGFKGGHCGGVFLRGGERLRVLQPLHGVVAHPGQHLCRQACQLGQAQLGPVQQRLQLGQAPKPAAAAQWRCHGGREKNAPKKNKGQKKTSRDA
jgi:hypothetical protein